MFTTFEPRFIFPLSYVAEASVSRIPILAKMIIIQCV